MIKYLKNIIKFLMNYLNKLDNFLEDKTLKLIRTSQNTLGKNKVFVLSNNKLVKNKDLFFQIYTFLMSSETFLNFGEHKIIIVNAKLKNYSFNLHPNTLIKNSTTFNQY
jgi:hypothetical protein